MTVRSEAMPADAAGPRAPPPAPLARRLLAGILVYAAAAPFVFFLFFVIRGGWLAVNIALMTFPSSLIWLCLYSAPQGAVVGAAVGLMPRFWRLWPRAVLASLLGAAATIANSFWLGLALIDPPQSSANIVAVGLIGGGASVCLALLLAVLGRAGKNAVPLPEDRR